MKEKLTSLIEQEILSGFQLNKLKEQLKLKIHQYGDFHFSDDVWYCEKLHKNVSNKSSFSIIFKNIPEEYKKIVKYYSLIKEGSIEVINSKVRHIGHFLNYLLEYFEDYKLYQVNHKIINHYEKTLHESPFSERKKMDIYSSIIDFFVTMSEFPELPNAIPTKKIPPFKRLDNGKNSDNYIPSKVIQQYDKVMFDESNGLPTVVRAWYWLQRSFPNRASEVGSIATNCLRSLHNMYIINIPTWKQNGGYILEEIKTIPVLNSGHGKYIVDLIKRCQEERKAVLSKFIVDERHKNYLLLYPTFYLTVKKNTPFVYHPGDTYLKILEFREKYPELSYPQLSEKMKEFGFNIPTSTIRNRLRGGLNDKYLKARPFGKDRFGNILSRIAEIYSITDENDEIYTATTHQFRHNSTTDRLYIGGYTIDQVRTIRNDKGESMPMQYAHQQKESHKKMWMESTQLVSPTEAPVEFKGHIFNLNDKTVDILSKKPQMYLTWEVNNKKGVGLCSRIHGCNPSGTTVHFECYECSWFVPKAEYYEDYKQEHEYWIDILHSCANQNKRAAIFENAIRNANILERIIQICENGIEKYQDEIERKVVSGELE